MTTAETRQQRRHRARQEKKGEPKPHKGAYRRALEAFKERAEALKAAMSMGQIAPKLALMDLANRLGTYKSRGHGRGTPSRNYMRPRGHNKAHQGAQERMRRALGGFAFAQRMTGLNKRETIALVDRVGAGKYLPRNIRALTELAL